MSLMDCNELKDQIRRLKAERKEMVRVRKTRKAIEEQTKLEFQEELLNLVNTKEEEICRLKKQLNDSIQRERNTRARLEKSNKTLQKRVDELNSRLEQDEARYEDLVKQKEAELEYKLEKERNEMRRKLEENEEATSRRLLDHKELMLKRGMDFFKRCEEGYERSLELVDRVLGSLGDSTASSSVENSFASTFNILAAQKLLLQRVQQKMATKEAQLKTARTELQQQLARIQHLESQALHTAELHQVQLENLGHRQNRQIKQITDNHEAELDDIQQRVKVTLDSKDSKIKNLGLKLKELESTIESKDADMNIIASVLCDESS